MIQKIANKDKKYGAGFLDFKEPFELKYDSIAAFEDDFALVQRNNLFGCINYSGKEVIPIKYRLLEHLAKIME
ncbi:WG repeat-containing protein [Flavobacterium chungbukense]|uniref:Uncharacterized protein n=1 Tax=Flavobacterium chungbukense TaxID=877464 RepID=A0ABP7YGB5_9FLAO|nr:WG repeat-containing protein [Flavobacterium chungbukense]MCC4920580.1 WG repeat-containing protein [Flavobacterium chungbukense]